MSRDYGRVRVQFWESESIRPLEPSVKFLGLYLLTSPHTNAIGCFRLPMAYVAHDTGMDMPALEQAFAALRAAGFLEWGERVPWVYLPNYLRHNPPENPNVWRKCVKEMHGLPVELSARAKIALELYQIAAEERMTKLDEAERNRLEPYLNSIETVSKGITPIPCPKPIPEPLPTPRASARGTDSLNGHSREFEAFWSVYPKKTARGAAVKAYLDALKKALPSDILRGAEAYARARKDEDEQFTKAPATWLEDECWLDEGATFEPADPAKAAAQLARKEAILKR